MLGKQKAGVEWIQPAVMRNQSGISWGVYPKSVGLGVSFLCNKTKIPQTIDSLCHWIIVELLNLEYRMIESKG